MKWTDRPCVREFYAEHKRQFDRLTELQRPFADRGLANVFESEDEMFEFFEKHWREIPLVAAALYALKVRAGDDIGAHENYGRGPGGM